MRPNQPLLLCLLFSLLTACGQPPTAAPLAPAAAQPPAPVPTTARPAVTATPLEPDVLMLVAPDAPVKRGLTYCTLGGVALQMDIYYPQKAGGGPYPLVIFIHGGGWTGGDRLAAGRVDSAELLRRGYVVASVDYRLAPQYPFPAMIQDVKCALRHLRARAQDYNIDPQRVGVMGSSAGGHLAALVGTSDTAAGFDVGDNLNQSSRVRAVVDLFGPADLQAGWGSQAGMERIFGRDPTGGLKESLRLASPVTYINQFDPPFLILQGDRDTTVPPLQSQILHDALLAVGVPVQLVMVKNAGHGFVPIGGAIQPDRQEISRLIADFFDANLK